MDIKKQIIDRIAENHLFRSGSPAFKEKLEKEANLTRIHKGQVLFIAQEDADKFYIIHTGWVKLFRETFDGTQAIIDILSQNHMFGETSIFEDDAYPFSAEAIEPSEIISFPLSLLKNEIENNPAFSIAMLSSMARYRKQQDLEIEHRTLQNAPQRIGCFLLRLANQEHKGPITIHLPYDKTLVASRLGMQPETFSRALSKLKDATGISVKGSTIEINNLSDLSGFSCAACSSEFPCQDLKKETV